MVSPSIEPEVLDGETQEPDLAGAVAEALTAEHIETVRGLVEPLHYADLADLLERLSRTHRRALVEILRNEIDPEVLPELDDAVRDEIFEQLGMQEVADAVAELDTDDAVNLVEELAEDAQGEILEALPDAERSAIEEGLTYPEDSAGRLMQRDVISVPSHWTVGQTIDHLRADPTETSGFFDVYLVDRDKKPIGSVPVGRLLTTHRHVAMNAIMSADLRIIRVDTDQEDVAFLFRQRDLVSAPVVDHTGRLVGSITVDDVVDVIDEEHEEDIMRLASVGADDDLYSAIFDTTRRRAAWLGVHLCAAAVAAVVISFFTETIEQLVVLAVLMPIVAALGGTAGVQTLTVSVRAIATKELTPSNAFRTIGKEILVGVLNGLLFAVVIGLVAWAWIGSPAIGLVIGLAIAVNLIVAGLAGSALPIGLQRLGFDPAVASSALLTSITDVVGFYVFLGLATILLL